MMDLNRNRAIAIETDLFVEAKAAIGKRYLHLGCGGRVLEGFINVDKYHKHEKVESYDMYQLPYNDGSIHCVYTSHALEHLPIRHGKLAISEMSRVLEPKGRLYLMVPDLEIIIHKLLDPVVSEDEYEWYLYTLFGFQTKGDNRDPKKLDYPVDHGQFHCNGYTKKSITSLLESNDIQIKEIFNYDGWGTPSLYVEGIKL